MSGWRMQRGSGRERVKGGGRWSGRLVASSALTQSLLPCPGLLSQNESGCWSCAGAAETRKDRQRAPRGFPNPTREGEREERECKRLRQLPFPGGIDQRRVDERGSLREWGGAPPLPISTIPGTNTVHEHPA